MRRVLFLADQFCDVDRTPSEKRPGGAELTDAAAIAACPWQIDRVTMAAADPSSLDRYDLIVVSNAGAAGPALLAALARHGGYVLFEHDLRICRWRGNFFGTVEPVHQTLLTCCCPHAAIAPLFDRALGVVFLTERQRCAYLRNPFFREPPSRVLGCSLFSDAFFAEVGRAAAQRVDHRAGTCILLSPNEIKGSAHAREYCRSLGIDPIELRDLTPEAVLERLSRSKAFVYLPRGLEPAGRMPVEARLLGCDVILNANVGVAGEAWWLRGRRHAIDFVQRAPERFWWIIDEFSRRPPRTQRSGWRRRWTRTLAERAVDLAITAAISGRLRRLGISRVPRDTLDAEYYPGWR